MAGDILGHPKTQFELNERITLHSTVLAFMTVGVITRVYTRAIIVRKFCLDDYMCLLAWVFCFIFSIFMVYVTKFGLNKYLIDKDDSIAYGMGQFAIRIYHPSMLSVKLCLLLGFHRVFKVDTRTRNLIWAGIAVNTIAYTVFFFFGLFRCRPIRAAWDPDVKGVCASDGWTPWAIGLFNVFSDFYILFLPMPIVFAMTMTTMRRIRLTCIFGLGLLTCVASVICAVVRIRASRGGTRRGDRELHWTYFCICLLELNVGLFCACATTFPAFFDADRANSFGALLSRLGEFRVPKSSIGTNTCSIRPWPSFRSDRRRSQDSLERLKGAKQWC